MDKNRKIYDVIIVGAGPSGLMLARQLDKTPLKILLIDENESYKQTQAGIYGCFRYIIERLGLSQYIHSEQNGLNLYGSEKLTSFFYEYKPFVTVNITKWAHDLELHSKYLPKTRITQIKKISDGYDLVDNQNNLHRGKVIVDCTGYQQALSQKLGVKPSNNQYYNASFELTDCTIPKNRSHDASVAYDHTNSNMGLWFYAYNEHECQLGLGDIIPSIKEKTPQIVARAKASMNNYPFNEWLTNARIQKTTVGIGPTLQIHKPIVKDNFLSIGNAGGMGIPFTGEGLRYQLEMADISSQVIYEAIVTGNYSQRNLQRVENYFQSTYQSGFFHMNILQKIAKDYIDGQTADKIIQLVSKRFSHEEFYNFAYGRLNFSLLLKFFDPNTCINVIKNGIQFHLWHKTPK